MLSSFKFVRHLPGRSMRLRSPVQCPANGPSSHLLCAWRLCASHTNSVAPPSTAQNQRGNASGSSRHNVTEADVDGLLRRPYTKDLYVRSILVAFLASSATAYYYAITIYDEEIAAHGSGPVRVAAEVGVCAASVIAIQQYLPPAVSLTGGPKNALTVGFAAVTAGFFGAGCCRAILRSWGAPPLMQAPTDP